MFWRTWIRNNCFFKSRAKSLLTCDKENLIDELETAQEEAGTADLRLRINHYIESTWSTFAI